MSGYVTGKKDKKKGALAKKGFDPRMAFGVASYGTSKVSAPSTVGPKEQIIKLDQSVKGRGTGTIGETIGKPKRKKSFTRSTGNMTAGRSSRSR